MSRKNPNRQLPRRKPAARISKRRRLPAVNKRTGNKVTITLEAAVTLFLILRKADSRKAGPETHNNPSGCEELYAQRRASTGKIQSPAPTNDLLSTRAVCGVCRKSEDRCFEVYLDG